MDFNLLNNDSNIAPSTSKDSDEKKLIIEGVDFLSIGKHCSEETCKQLDFLPFKCDDCARQFCVDHFEPTKHNCKNVVEKDSRLPQCPLCMQYLSKGVRGVDDNAQVERHIQSNCKLHLLTNSKPKKNKCATSKCKQRSLIPFTCGSCYQQFCVRHRHPGDHACFKPMSNLIPVRWLVENDVVKAVIGGKWCNHEHNYYFHGCNESCDWLLFQSDSNHPLAVTFSENFA